MDAFEGVQSFSTYAGRSEGIKQYFVYAYKGEGRSHIHENLVAFSVLLFRKLLICK